MRTHFLRLGHSKKRLGRSRRSDVLIAWMAVGTHYLSSRRLKKRLCWSQWSDISRCRKDMETHFLHSVIEKNYFDEVTEVVF
jgi:hypothetical protein